MLTYCGKISVLISVIMLHLISTTAIPSEMKKTWFAGKCDESSGYLYGCFDLNYLHRKYGQGDSSAGVVLVESEKWKETELLRSLGITHEDAIFNILAYNDQKSQRRFVVISNNDKNEAIINSLVKALNESTDQETINRFKQRINEVSNRGGKSNECGGVPYGVHHDLKMANLITANKTISIDGEKYKLLGIAPGSNVSVGYADIQSFSGKAATLLSSKKNTRIVSSSQGQSITDAVRSTHYFYENLILNALELAELGPKDRFGLAHLGILLVSAAGNQKNVKGVYGFDEEKNKQPYRSFSGVLTKLLFYETILSDLSEENLLQLQQTTGARDITPYFLNASAPFSVSAAPLLIVGGVDFRGNVPNYLRIDNGIELFAPTSPDAELSGSTQGWSSDSIRELQCNSSRNGNRAFLRGLGLPVLSHNHSIEDIISKSIDDVQEIELSVGYAGYTSAATALTAGAAALAVSLDPDINVFELKRVLVGGAKVSSTGGVNILDIERSLELTTQLMEQRIEGHFTEILIERHKFNYYFSPDLSTNVSYEKYGKSVGKLNQYTDIERAIKTKRSAIPFEPLSSPKVHVVSKSEFHNAPGLPIPTFAQNRDVELGGTWSLALEVQLGNDWQTPANMCRNIIIDLTFSKAEDEEGYKRWFISDYNSTSLERFECTDPYWY